nr:ribonuclease H-like domain-containing protein [Tanacetum cinerariifolium]
MSDHEDETITAENAPPKNIPQITTVTNISAKFPYLKKGEYDIWAMKMQNFISSSDLLCWNILLKGNSAKSMTTDNDGNMKIRPPITIEKHQQVQREEKARTILLSALPDEHMDAKDLDSNEHLKKQARSKRHKHEVLKGVAFFLVWVFINSPTLSNAATVSTAGSSQGNLSYQESGNGGYGGYTTTLSASPDSSSSKGSLKSKCSVVDDINKDEFEEYDLKHQMAMLSIKQMGHFSRECRAQGAQTSNNYQKYKSKEAGKDISDSKAMVVVDGSIDWDKQTKKSNTEPRSLENFGMIAGIKLESDDDSEGEVVSADAVISTDVSIFSGLVAAAAVSPQSETEFALMGLSTEAAQEKQDLMTKLDNELANQAKWNNGGKNLYKLIDSSMSVRTKQGLGLDKYIRKGKLGIDDFVFSIFHTTSDDLEGQPIYNRFASVDNMKAVPPPLTGNYMPPSNIPDIDESQMVYGKTATDSSEIKTNDDSISHSHDSVLFYFSDSYLHLIKDCDFHEQTFVKRNTEGKGKLGRRSTGKPINPNRPHPVSAGQPYRVSVGQPNPVSAGQPNLNSARQQNTVSDGSPNPVYAGQPNPVSAGNGILVP